VRFKAVVVLHPESQSALHKCVCIEGNLEMHHGLGQFAIGKRPDQPLPRPLDSSDLDEHHRNESQSAGIVRVSFKLAVDTLERITPEILRQCLCMPTTGIQGQPLGGMADGELRTGSGKS